MKPISYLRKHSIFSPKTLKSTGALTLGEIMISVGFQKKCDLIAWGVGDADGTDDAGV